MSDWECPFCGSDKLKIKKASGDVVKKNRFVWGEDMYEPVTDFCCRKQAKNAAYLKSRYDPTISNIPELDDIAKL